MSRTYDTLKKLNRVGLSPVGISLLFLSLTLALVNVLPASVIAQAPIEAEVDFFVQTDDPNRTFTIGDQITLRLEIHHPSDSRVVLPQVEQQWQAFTVIDQTAPETVDHGDGTATTSRNIVVALFEPGEYQTPPIIVTHRKPDGSIEELATPVIQIGIGSVLNEGDSDLRDLKSQLNLPEPSLWPWIIASVLGTILLLGALAGLLFWLYHRWRTQPALDQPLPAPILDTRPPEVIAYAELDRIEALNLPAKNRIKEHYTLVAACLRGYIEGRYQIPALERTTDELRAAFRKVQLPSNDTTGLTNLMTESDFVKFARYQPRGDEITALINNARRVVNATTAAAKAREAQETALTSPKMEEVKV